MKIFGQPIVANEYHTGQHHGTPTQEMFQHGTKERRRYYCELTHHTQHTYCTAQVHFAMNCSKSTRLVVEVYILKVAFLFLCYSHSHFTVPS